MNEYMEKCLSIHSFSFYGPRILKREQWIQSKIIGIERFKRRISVKEVLKWGNDVSKNLASPRVGPCLSLHYTLPPPPRKVHLWHTFFALPITNGPLPAKLKFRKNTEHVGLFASHATINALTPLTFLWTSVSSNKENSRQFKEFFTAISFILATSVLSSSLLVFAKEISTHYSVLLNRIALPLLLPTQKVRPSSSC